MSAERRNVLDLTGRDHVSLVYNSELQFLAPFRNSIHVIGSHMHLSVFTVEPEIVVPADCKINSNLFKVFFFS